MVMMGSQSFFSLFSKKTCKILVSFRNFIYLCSALSVEIQEERTSAPWQQDAQARSMRSEFGSKCSAG